ncbi:MarR family protein [Neomoorella glycerini]|uniref:MarR family protein n=1 Tax=Neomoorella glycerini TaxID=55779 RepID=A0A6I5ZQA9_9FIRM|nr:MarR family transcriptional regulator [Moorella glycerini]QGP92143.1 MarR family protein [Moorella glycerini]
MTGGHDLEEITVSLVDALWQFWRMWRQVSHPVRKGKITPEQYWLLKRLKHGGPLNIGELAEGLGITSSSATTATKRLAKMGLVRRVRQKEDERVVTVELTSAGLEMLEQWASEQRAALASLLMPLTLEERILLLKLIRKVNPL